MNTHETESKNEYHCDCPNISKCCDELNALKTQYPLMNRWNLPSPAEEKPQECKHDFIQATKRNDKICRLCGGMKYCKHYESDFDRFCKNNPAEQTSEWEDIRRQWNEAFPPPMLLGQNQERVATWWINICLQKTASAQREALKKVGEMALKMKRTKNEAHVKYDENDEIVNYNYVNTSINKGFNQAIDDILQILTNFNPKE